MNYIKRFQNAQALSFSVGNSYYEDQLMNIFLYNFQQGGQYTAQIASHQAELIREEIFTDQRYLSIISIQTDYLYRDSISGSGRNNERANFVQTKCTFCGDANHSADFFEGL